MDHNAVSFRSCGVLDLEQEECCGSDLRDATGVEANSAQGLEGGLEHGAGAFADAVDAADDLVVGLLGLGTVHFRRAF